MPCRVLPSDTHTHNTADYAEKHLKPRYTLDCSGQLISPLQVHMWRENVWFAKIKARCAELKLHGHLPSQPNWVNSVFYSYKTFVFCKLLLKLLSVGVKNTKTRSQNCYTKLLRGKIKSHKSSSDNSVAIYLAVTKCSKETFSWPPGLVLISHIASALTPHSFCLSSSPLSLTRHSPSPALEPYLMGTPPLFA